ncbi:transglycosylase domain-containing protein [Actinomyces slackii]|uniref:transglycosylase domain-containing protein n=1 Tax=Actinomyces slackii TaxID=52774 RepID=UPI0005566A25
MAHRTNQGVPRPGGSKLSQALSAGRQASVKPPKKPRATSKSASGKASAASKRTGWRRVFNYPRAGKGPIHRWIPSWRFVLGCFLMGVLAVIGLFAYAYSTIKVPDPSEFAQAQTTTVYYADGTTVMGEFAEIDRTIVDSTTLPDYVGQSIVASEDRSFYTNNGVDPKGIVRALWNNLRGGDTQGASTLTQQYVKNYYVDTTDSYFGKFQQAIMAIKIDREQSKDQILGAYLNTVYYGRSAYGIEAAAQAFYDKSAKDMTVSEAALLAGILPAPSAWDPAENPDKAKERWQRVMDHLLADGYISQADYDSAAFPETITPANEQVYSGPNGHLLQMVRAELKTNAKLTDQQIDTGGLRITSTIDKADQDAIISTAQSLPEGYSENLKVAMVSVDAKTGGLLALYGGPDYLINQVNTATDAVAQAGSTYKPFALVGGMEQGLTLSNGYKGDSPMTIAGHSFQNFRNASFGWINLIEATKDSVNTPYLQLNEDLGPEETNKVAIRAGYPEDTQGMNDFVQNVLGSASPHTIDIASAYSTFAAQGVRRDTHIVNNVTGPDGTVTYSAPTEGKQTFDSGVMADTSYALQQVVNDGSATKVQALGRPVAAKTGSSSDNKSAQFVGYTPQVVTAVTLYQSGPNGEEESITPWGEYDEITGSTYPADLFVDYMETALADLPIEEFPPRTDRSYTRGALYGEPGEVEEDYSTQAPQATQEPTQEIAPEPTQEPTAEATQAPTQEAPSEPSQAPTGEGGGGNTAQPGDQPTNPGGGIEPQPEVPDPQQPVPNPPNQPENQNQQNQNQNGG